MAAPKIPNSPFILKFKLRTLMLATVLFAICAFLCAARITEFWKAQKFHSKFASVVDLKGDYRIQVDHRLDDEELALLMHFADNVTSLKAIEIENLDGSLRLRDFRNLRMLSISRLDDPLCSDLAALPAIESVSVTDKKIDRQYVLKLLESCPTLQSFEGSFDIEPFEEIQNLRPNDKIWVSLESERSSGEHVYCLGFEVGARVVPIDDESCIDLPFEIGMSLADVRKRIDKPHEKLPFGVYSSGDEPIEWLRKTPKYTLIIDERKVELVFNHIDEVIRIHPVEGSTKNGN